MLRDAGESPLDLAALFGTSHQAVQVARARTNAAEIERRPERLRKLYM